MKIPSDWKWYESKLSDREARVYLREIILQAEKKANDGVPDFFAMKFGLTRQQSLIAAELYRNRGAFLSKHRLIDAISEVSSSDDIDQLTRFVTWAVRKKLAGTEYTVTQQYGMRVCMTGPDMEEVA